MEGLWGCCHFLTVPYGGHPSFWVNLVTSEFDPELGPVWAACVLRAFAWEGKSGRRALQWKVRKRRWHARDARNHPGRVWPPEVGSWSQFSRGWVGGELVGWRWHERGWSGEAVACHRIVQTDLTCLVLSGMEGRWPAAAEKLSLSDVLDTWMPRHEPAEEEGEEREGRRRREDDHDGDSVAGVLDQVFAT